MPESPTPGVNGQGDSSVAKMVVPHGALSISSFEPAARIAGREASIATAGSFCLFRGNGLVGLPTVTRACVAAAAVVAKATVKNTKTATVHVRRKQEYQIIKPPPR